MHDILKNSATGLDDARKTRKWHQSVITRLQAAFCAMAILTLCACVLAILRFGDAGRVVSELTDVSIPSVKLSLALENQAADVVRSVGELSRSTSEAQRAQFSTEVLDSFSGFEEALERLHDAGGG